MSGQMEGYSPLSWDPNTCNMHVVQVSLAMTPLFTVTEQTTIQTKHRFPRKGIGTARAFLGNRSTQGNRSHFKFLEMSSFSHLEVWKQSRAALILMCMFQIPASISRSNHRSTKGGEERGAQRSTGRSKKHRWSQEFLPQSVCLCGWAVSPQSQRLLKHELSFAFRQTPKLITRSGERACLGLSSHQCRAKSFPHHSGNSAGKVCPSTGWDWSLSHMTTEQSHSTPPTSTTTKLRFKCFCAL